MIIRSLSLLISLIVPVASGALIVVSGQGRQMGGVGITVFVDRNYQGKSATFREEVPDLRPSGFNDRIRSLRVARGERWEVCEHSNYQGRCVVISGDEPDLRRNSWSNIISSMRRIDGGGSTFPAPGRDYIVLFDQSTFRGTPTNFYASTPNLFGRRVQSITVGQGVWEVCEGTNFSGRCVTLERSVPNLAASGLRRVSSLRPASGRPTPPTPSDWLIILFDQTNYRGRATNYNGSQANINQVARSATLTRGVWELCTGRNFTGNCFTLDSSSPDLGRQNLPTRFASLRPLVRQPR